MATPSVPSQQLDVRAFARTAGRLAGVAPLSAFARVMQDCVQAGRDEPVAWSAEGSLRHDAQGAAQVWLVLGLQTELQLTCQRCLEPVGWPLQVERAFRFVADEASAMQQDDDAEEDLLVESDRFDLFALVEDELVLAMPLIARHPQCPDAPTLSVQDRDFDAAQPQPARPFEALAALKRR